jgi:hypothetical protein
MSIDKKIDRKKKQLYSAISTKGIMHKNTIRLSEQLDILIVERMRGTITL